MHVELLEARNLAPRDNNSPGDPYVIVKFGKKLVGISQLHN